MKVIQIKRKKIIYRKKTLTETIIEKCKENRRKNKKNVYPEYFN